MIPKCPINNIEIRQPVICSDGYMYEQKCLEECLKTNYTSPVNRKIIEYARPCNFEEKCLNDNSGVVEDEYEGSKFEYSENKNLFLYYCRMLENGEKISNRLDNNRTMNLFEKYGNKLDFDSDFLIKYKNFILECVKQNGYSLKFAFDELKNDRDIVMEAVKIVRALIYASN